MLITSTRFVHIFLNRREFLKLTLVERSNYIIVLRQQKILARFAFFCQNDNIIKEFDPASQRHLNNALKVATTLKSQVRDEAKDLDRVLQKVSKFVVFLKGAAYSLSNRLVGEGRIYGDIDVLINKEQLKDCEKSLAIEGWFGQEITDYDTKYYRRWAHEIPPLIHMQRGTIVDVHHNIIPIVSRDAPTVERLSNYIVKNIDSLQVLSDEAQFVHSAVHLFRNEDYKNAFRDIQDLYLMIVDARSDFVEDVLKVATELGFTYETGLALHFVNDIFARLDNTLVIPRTAIVKCLNQKSQLRQHFDFYIFTDVLMPQHELLRNSQTPFKQLLAIFRGHCIKMPFPLLTYHILVKGGRSFVESIFGKHVFAPKDAQSESQKY